MQHLSSAHKDILSNAVMQAATAMEDAIDAELEEDLDSIRSKRLKELQEKASKREEWRKAGHGIYTEIEEKDFFEQAKKSHQVVIHFYRESNTACKVMDRHLAAISEKHLETRFLRLNAEKCPFLTERLKIWMLPTLVLVKDGKTNHSIVGLDELGGREDFKQQLLEWHLSKYDVLDYEGPPPSGVREKLARNKVIFTKKKGITGSKYNRGSDSEEDYSD